VQARGRQNQVLKSGLVTSSSSTVCFKGRDALS
jgi:hypothetical protein